MSQPTFLRALIISGIFFVASHFPQLGQANDAQSIVSIGGSVTEIVYALGQEDRLVARDTTSSFPEAAKIVSSARCRFTYICSTWEYIV